MFTFKSLFGKTKKSNQTPPIQPPNDNVETLQLPEENHGVDPLEKLFVENTPPEFQSQGIQPKENRLKIFLNEDYYLKGESSGYKSHAIQFLENGKNSIKAEFRLIIDQIIEEKKSEILHFRNMIVDVEKLSESKAIELQNTVEAIQSAIIKLNEQKNLSIENEGWVMPAIYKFTEGFMSGMNDWIESEGLVNGINIFNN